MRSCGTEYPVEKKYFLDENFIRLSYFDEDGVIGYSIIIDRRTSLKTSYMDMPSEVYYKHGHVWTEEWQLNDAAHRIGKPAYLRYGTGSKVIVDEHWYQDGGLYREDGPCVTRYNKDGIVKAIVVMRDGRTLPDDAFIGLAPGSNEWKFTYELA